MTDKRQSRFKIGLISLLAMPLCFAMGWILRGWTFERDVDAEARQIATHVNGHYVPELGAVVGGKDAAKRYDEISEQDAEEIQRRIQFFRQLRGGSSDTTPWPTPSLARTEQ